MKSMQITRHNRRTNGRTSDSHQVVKIITDLETAKQAFSEIDKRFAKVAGTSVGRKLMTAILWVAKPVLPSKWYQNWERRLSLLENIRAELSSLIEEVEVALISLAELATTKQAELKEYGVQLKRAKEEQWDVKQLREYLFEVGRVPNAPEISWLLDEQLELLTPVQLADKKDELLQVLESNIHVGEQVIQLMAKVAEAGLETLEKAAIQYWGLSEFIEPLEVLRQAATNAVAVKKSSFEAKEIVHQYLGQIVSNVELSIEATELLRQFLITGPETHQELTEYVGRLDNKIQGLYNSAKRSQLKQSRINLLSRTPTPTPISDLLSPQPATNNAG
ncbi:MAG: hypothetical protein QMD50_00630 [Patescibacteria group bacterium]|nr:hypothetical protein [Patescibacteria group bacterium]